MRICYIVEAMSAGVGRHVVDLACGMATCNHEVHIIYSPNRADPALLEEIAGLPSIKVHSIPMRRAPHPLDVVALFKITKYFLSNGPFDIVHGHSSKGGLFSRLVALISTSGSIYTPHAFATMSPELSAVQARFYQLAERLLGRISSKVICVSWYEHEHALKLAIPPEKLAIIRHALNPIGFSPAVPLRRELGIPPETMIVGFVGRMEYQKGMDVLLKAARLALDRCSSMHFVLIGEGSLRKTLQMQAEELGLSEHCTWLGHQPARRYYEALDVVVAPSRYEGLPYSLMEALSSGTLVVSTAFGGCTELIDDGENGYIVPLEDSETLAMRLIELAADEDLRRTMSANARRRSVFSSLDQMCAENEALYFGWPVDQARLSPAQNLAATAGIPAVVAIRETAEMPVTMG